MRILRTCFTVSIIFLLLCPDPARASTTPAFPTYVVGAIPSQTIYLGQTLNFVAVPPTAGGGVKVSFNPTPTGAAGFGASASSTLSLDTSSGFNTFFYTPSALDKFEFTATFTSGGTSQSVVITPVPQIQPEYDVVQTRLSLPDENQYITYKETNAGSTGTFNGCPQGASCLKGLRSIQISGKTITLDAKNDPLNLVPRLTSPTNVTQLTIYADTLIIRSSLALPQTDVTIYANQLTFQDPAGTAAGTANINTTPLSCSGPGPLAPAGWCSTPTAAAPDSNFNVAKQAGNGQDATAGGSVTLHIRKFTSTNDTLAVSGGIVTATRFIMNGGYGQDPGKGYGRSDPKFKVTDACHFPGGSALDGQSYCHITNIPAQSFSVANTTCNFGSATPPNNSIIWIQWNCAGVNFSIQNEPAPANACPTNGHPAAAWGKPGSGGNAGNLATSISIAQNGGQVEQFGGYGGSLGEYVDGGYGGLPTTAYWYQIAFGSAGIYHTCATTTDAPTLAPPFPNRIGGTPGSVTILSDAPYDWLHPYTVQVALQWARDAYLNGDFNDVHAFLSNYLPTVQAAAASTSSNAAQFGEFAVEIQGILNRLDSNLDYYGNPAGWVPLFSLQTTMSLLSQEDQAAVPIVALSEEIQAISDDQAKTIATLNAEIASLKDEVTATSNELTDPNTGLFVTIQTLQAQAISISQQVTTIQAQIATEKQALEAQARSDVTAANQLPFWEQGLKLLGAVVQLVPVVQPVFGIVGQGLNLLSNLDSSPNAPTAQSQGDPVAAKATDADLTQALKNLNTNLTKLNGDTKKDNSSISGYIKSVGSAYTDLSKGIGQFRQALQDNGAPDAAIKAELTKLTNSDKTLATLVAAVNNLNAQKAQNVQSMSAALDKLSKDIATINADLNSIVTFQDTVDIDFGQMNYGATLFVKDLEKRQLDRLQKYLYYMSKAYEYRFLTPYTGDLTLDNWLIQLKKLLQTKNNTLANTDIANLLSIYEAQVRQVVANGVDVMASNPPQMSQVVKFGLTASELNSLNTTGSVTINLFDKIGGIPGQQNQRINALGVIGTELAVQSNAATLSTGTLNITASYFGQSTIANGGHTYFFRFGTPQFENPFTWGGNYDLVDQTFTPNVPSVDGLSLLNAFLNKTSATSQITNGLSLFAEPGANSAITISRSVIPAAATATITNLRMSVGVDFYPSNVNQLTLTVQAPVTDAAYVAVSQADVTGRTDGIGTFSRVYARGTSVTLTAEPTYAGVPFAKWVDSNNNTVSTVPTLSLMVSGARTVTPTYVADSNTGKTAPFSIADRGGALLKSSGTGASVSVGYAAIQPQAGSIAPTGLAIFGFRQNNILVTEASVPASPLVQSGRIYAEVSGPINTGLAIANPNDQQATITFYFTNASGNFGSGSLTIPAYGQIAKFLDQTPFNSPSSFTGSFTFTSSVPVSVVALRGHTNERNEFLITTLPVANITGTPSTATLVFPHFADGGGWLTQIALVNPGDIALTGTVQFLSTSGSILKTQSYSIPARSSQAVQTAGTDATTTVGSVRVVPATNTPAPSGVAIFSYKNAGYTVTEAGVPATPAGNAFRLYAENGPSIQTGIAITNTSSSTATVSLELTRLDGSSTGLTGTLTVPANGQSALFLNQVAGFASLPATFQGVLRVSSASAISVTGLRGRYNERNDFLVTTTSPVNEATPASAGPLLFPHIVDSGGYTTQFILFSPQPGPQPSGIIQFFSQTGTPWTALVQ